MQPFPAPVPAASDDPLISTDYAGWWHRTGRIMRTTWPQLVVLQLAGTAVSLTYAIGLSTYRPSPDDASGAQRAAAAAGDLVDALVQCAMTLTVVYLVVLTAAGRRPTLGAALRAAGRRLLPLFGWLLLAGLLTSLGMCFLVLPGIAIAAILLLLPPVVAIERGQGVGRCFELCNAARGAATARMGTIFAVTLAAVLLTETQPGLTTAGVDSALVGAVIGSLAAAAVNVFVAPLSVTAYADLRARREPLSTATLAAQMTGPPVG